MDNKERFTFYTPKDQNDIDNVEAVIYPVFSRTQDIHKSNWEKIRALFFSGMKNAGLNHIQRCLFWFLVNRLITRASRNQRSLNEVENTLRKVVRWQSENKKKKKRFVDEWTQRNFLLIKEHIVGQKILDLGAGTGLLAQEIQNQLKKEVLLIDVIDFNLSDLPLILYSPEDDIPLSDQEVDTTILLTVLHHAQDPIHLMNEATRITRQRLIIVDGCIEEPEMKITNSFFDWFYNRVLADKDISVPLNFLKMFEWEKLLTSYSFNITESQILGLNDPLVPEHHLLIVADRQ